MSIRNFLTPKSPRRKPVATDAFEQTRSTSSGKVPTLNRSSSNLNPADRPAPPSPRPGIQFCMPRFLTPLPCLAVSNFFFFVLTLLFAESPALEPPLGAIGTPPPPRPKKPLPVTPRDDDDGDDDPPSLASPEPSPRVEVVPLQTETTHQLDEKTRKRRAQIAEEMWASEKSYYEAIAAMETVYGPALAEAPLKFVTPQKRAAIVGNISAVLAVSASLVQVLRERCVEQWAAHSCVGDVWVAFAAQFSVYQTYIRGHREAILALDSLDSKREFGRWMRELEEANPGVKALGNLLIMPVQRMPRYVMLISSLLEKTPEWHRDHKPLAQGLVSIEEMVSGVDGAIERQENLQKTYDVARRLGLADLMSVDTRLYVRDGTLTKVCRKQDKERWFVLFSDILIYAAFDPTKLSMKHEVLLLDRTAISDYSERPFSFSIRSEQKSFVVVCVSDAEKREWTEALQVRIADCGGGSTSAAKTAPLWTPDKHSARCTRCLTEFTMVNRRHHCRKCGVLVCGKCSSYKMLVPNIDPKKPVRVCDECLMAG